MDFPEYEVTHKRQLFPGGPVSTDATQFYAPTTAQGLFARLIADPAVTWAELTGPRGTLDTFTRE